MDTSLVQISAVSLVLVPVAAAITQVVKGWIVDARWAGLASIVFGILLAFVVPQTTVALTVLQGLLIGLTASGAFSAIKAMGGTPVQE